ncbi:BQ5605_C006g04181 [Microbotryum silenes-dioicae]|uniref:BQ5605_C006g04181 protein n=1 Tax=Microbotryum silenes-dioicae TaxID=796604 RepID=A0A2X0P8T1_9BASI|nr:BQ5605_C006g04181 [Microbotryum silenes-dioicae]
MELTQVAHTDKRPRTDEDMDIDKAPKSTCPTLSPVFEQHWTHFDNFGGGGSDFNDPHSDDEIGGGDRSRFGRTAEEVTIPELVPPAAGEQSAPEEWKEDGLEPEAELTREEAAALRWSEPDEDFDEGLAGLASGQGCAADRRTEADLGTPVAGSPPQRSVMPLAAVPSEVYPLDRRTPVYGGERSEVGEDTPVRQTTLALAVWARSHNVSEAEFEAIASIIHGPSFSREQVPASLKTVLSRIERRLPLPQIKSHLVPVELKKTTYNLKARKEDAPAFTIPLIEILRTQIVGDSSLWEKYHFGFGQQSTHQIRENCWDGESWNESLVANRSEYPIFSKDGTTRLYPGVFVQYPRSSSRYLVKDAKAWGQIRSIWRDVTAGGGGGLVLHIMPLVNEFEASNAFKKMVNYSMGRGGRTWSQYTLDQRLILSPRRRIAIVDGHDTVRISDVEARVNNLDILRRFTVEDSPAGLHEEVASTPPDRFFVDTALVHGVGRHERADPAFTWSTKIPLTIAEQEVLNDDINPEILPAVEERPREVRVATRTVVLSLFHDNFAVFRQSAHSVGGWYAIVASSPPNCTRFVEYKVALRLHAAWCVCGDLRDVANPTLRELAYLARTGIEMEAPDGHKWVIFVKVINARADMPEAAEQAGVLTPTANISCRHCTTPRDHLVLPPLDPVTLFIQQRTLDETNACRSFSHSLPTKAERGAYLSSKGLKDTPDMYTSAGLTFDPHTQLPPDPYHLVTGVATTFLTHVIKKMLSDKGRSALSRSRTLDPPLRLTVPSFLGSLLDPSYIELFTMRQRLLLMSIFPFLLAIALESEHHNGLSETTINLMKARKLKGGGKSIMSPREILRNLINTSKRLARLTQLCFGPTATRETDNEIDDIARSLPSQIVQVIAPFDSRASENGTVANIARLPNLHALRHLTSSSRAFRTIQILSVAIDEEMHRLSKAKVATGNRREVTKAFAIYSVVRGSLASAERGLGSPVMTKGLKQLRKELPTLMSWLDAPDDEDQLEMKEASEDTTAPNGVKRGTLAVGVERLFARVHLIKEIKGDGCRRLGYSTELSRGPDGPAGAPSGIKTISIASLRDAYAADYEIGADRLHRLDWYSPAGRVRFWKRFRYDDRVLERLVTIQVGDLIQVAAPEGSTTNFAFARVRAIFSNELDSSGERYLFMDIEWMKVGSKKSLPLLGQVETVELQKRANAATAMSFPKIIGLFKIAHVLAPHVMTDFMTKDIHVVNAYMYRMI